MRLSAYLSFIAGILIPSCAFAMPSVKNNYGAGKNIPAIENKIADSDYTTIFSLRQQQNEKPKQMPIILENDDTVVLANTEMLAEIAGISNYSAKPNNLPSLTKGTIRSLPDIFAKTSQTSFGAYAYISDPMIQSQAANKWEINSSSQDSKLLHGGTVVVPAPGALLLAAIGAVIIGWVRKSRMMA